MPMSVRTAINSASLIVSTRLPLTTISPPSGFSNPRMSLRMVDFPPAAATEDDLGMARQQFEADILQHHLSSKASDTFLSTIDASGIHSGAAFRRPNTTA